MKALCWEGKHKISTKEVAEPKILNPHDAIVKVTMAAICGSDLHLYDGYIPTMHVGDILGHETMGIVMEVGSAVRNTQIGDRVVIPFDIACGECHFCQKEEYSACDNTNPNSVMAEKSSGYSGSGLFGYSHMYGGYAGGQAEFIRVPFVDVNSLKVPESLADEQVLFLSDIFPTGYMAAENCNIRPGDTVAIWGAGPVGQMAIRSAFLLGAEKVLSIDHYKGRLQMSEDGGAQVIDFDDVDAILDELNYRTGGRGPDSCIDAVGMEAHGSTLTASLDRVKAAAHLATDRPDVLRQVIQACKKCGTVSVPGVYGGALDKIPFGAAFGKGLTLKMGQTHTQKFMKPLLKVIENGAIDPSFVITHRMNLDEGAEAYKKFSEQKDQCMKVVFNM